MEDKSNRGMRWSPRATKILLDSVIEKIKGNPDKFEKPVAARFYNAVKENKAIIKEYSWKSMRDKMRNLKMKYNVAINLRNKMGQGVLESSGEKSVKDYINKICPYFDELYDIFGSGANVNIDVVYDSEGKFADLMEVVNDCCEYEYLAAEVGFDNSIQRDDGVAECGELENLLQLERPADASAPKVDEVPKSSTTFKKQHEKSTRKRKHNFNTTRTVAYLLDLQKERAHFNKIKLEMKKGTEEEKLKLDLRKIEFNEQIQSRKICIEEKKVEIEEKKVELERERIKKEMQVKLKEIESKKEIEMLRIEKEVELKKFEIEMKHKYDKEV